MATSATPKKPGIPASVITAQVDELGDIEKTLAPHRNLIARETALRSAIRTHFDASPATEPFEALGERYVVLVGPRAIERAINYVKLIKAISLKTFATFAKCTLKDLEAKVACGIVADVVTSGNTGARTLKVFERGTAHE